jgi:hypothetical protein
MGHLEEKEGSKRYCCQLYFYLLELWATKAFIRKLPMEGRNLGDGEEENTR